MTTTPLQEAIEALRPFAAAWEAAKASKLTTSGELGALAIYHLDGAGARFRRASETLARLTREGDAQSLRTAEGDCVLVPRELLKQLDDALMAAFGEYSCEGRDALTEAGRERFEANFAKPARDVRRKLHDHLASAPKAQSKAGE